VDESGNQLSVFGRRGSRPMNLSEMMSLYIRNGRVFTVPEIKSESDIRSHFGNPR
jgi:hypothetical protein